MNQKFIERINGGWKNVPFHLKSRDVLKEMQLKPKNKDDYKAEVWNGYNWIKLYDVNECIKRREPTVKQLEALELARKKRREKSTCQVCNQYYSNKKYVVYKENRVLCQSCARRECEELLEQEKQAELRKLAFELKTNDFIVVDTETTSLAGELIEISIIDKHNNVLFSKLVNSHEKIEEAATQVNGITNEMVKEAETWDSMYTEIKSIILNKTVLMFNADFHTTAIQRTCALYNLKELKFGNLICVMELFNNQSLADIVGKRSKRSLEQCQDILKAITMFQEKHLTKSN